MTKITIDIDTGSADREMIRAVKSAAITGPGQVGVVSAISMKGKNFETVFTGGLAAVDATIQIRAIKDKNDYKHGNTTSIESWVKTLSLTCDLIVTVGGAVAYEAAINAPSTKPFISVLGAIPKQPYPTLFRGGVSLSSLAMYNGAVQTLMGAPFRLGNPQICFLYNPNNDFSDDPNGLFADNELNYWTNTVNANVMAAGPNNHGDNDDATFAPAIQALATTPRKGIVVSADPFFQDKRETLIAAANRYWLNDNTRFICYPSFAYRNLDGTRPTASQSAIYGPNLEEAYFLAGQLAGTYVHTLKSGPDLPPVFVQVSGTQLIL
jgi:hypothetical protein